MPDKEKKNKHLTFGEVEEIQGCLDHGMPFKTIGRRIGKDQTTVSKEVSGTCRRSRWSARRSTARATRCRPNRAPGT
ncbi:MAG: helix-turn-helix domain-containing protein [Oscillospiraceae bacterium]|nr:helix-turn-helix domain-containing protein [Oscillospiraceae bacterium]